jgi:hypothetical protein
MLQTKIGNHRGGRRFGGGPATKEQSQGKENGEVWFH